MNKRQNSQKEKIIAQFKPQKSSSLPIQDILSKQSQKQALMVGILFVGVVAMLGYNAGKSAVYVKGITTTELHTVTPIPDVTRAWNQYDSTCKLVVKFPADWNIQKYFVQDNADWCAFLTAPDYVQNYDTRTGFFVSIQKTEQGSIVNGIVVNSLDDLVAANEQSTGQEVKNKQKKLIGQVMAIQFDPAGYEQLTSVVFQHKTTFYQLSWPVSAENEKNFVDPILRTLRFE